MVCIYIVVIFLTSYTLIFFFLLLLLLKFHCQLFLKLHYIIMSILCCYYNNGVYFSFSYGQSQPYALTNYNSLRFLLFSNFTVISIIMYIMMGLIENL